MMGLKGWAFTVVIFFSAGIALRNGHDGDAIALVVVGSLMALVGIVMLIDDIISSKRLK